MFPTIFVLFLGKMSGNFETKKSLHLKKTSPEKESFFFDSLDLFQVTVT